MSVSLPTSSVHLLEGYEDFESYLSLSGPSAFAAMRQDGFDNFSRVGWPTRHDEEFRYFSLREVEGKQYQFGLGANVDREELAKTVASALVGPVTAMVNGQLAPDLGVEQTLPKGAFLGSFDDAIEAGFEVGVAKVGTLATLDGKLGTTNDERFKHLNTAFLSEGIFVHVPRGLKLTTPLNILFVSKAELTDIVSYPRLFIDIEEGAEATVVECYIGLNGAPFTNSVVEVQVGDRAKLQLVRIQAETSETYHVGATYVVQGEDSSYTSVVVNMGSKAARHDANVFVGGENAHTRLDGVSVGKQSQVFDNHTRLDHAKPNCTSFEVYKTVLDDKAHGIFNGKIFVYLDAQKTDAKQTNQGLLLSRTAEFDTKPQLEIFADDVKCTHGATVGQLREDALFYLRARGIPKSEAQALLVYAFAAEVLDKIPVEPLKDFLESQLYSKLGTP